MEVDEPRPRIRSVTVNHFRGIEQGSLTFVDSTGRPQSAFILGDNGSGKSSYLEALNFGLTGRPPQLVEPNKRRRIDPRNIAAGPDDRTSVVVRLSDGRDVRSELNAPTQVEDFLRVALLIKREHLLALGRGSDEQLGGFLQTLVAARYLPRDSRSDTETGLREERAAARAEFDTAFEDLQARLRISAREKPNLSPRDVEIFRTARRITMRQTRIGRPGGHRRDVQDLVDLGMRLQAAADRHEAASNSLSTARRSRQHQRVIDILVRASDRLNDAFRKLAHEETRRIVSRIEIAPVDNGRVALAVILADGTTVSAASILSEASLDLAALLAVISLVRDGVDRGQPPVLVLDDVFHSVDNTLRDRFAAYLFDELPDWQLIIAFHDRVWFERFSDIAKERNFPHVRRRIWRGADGAPRVSEGYRSSKEYLEEVLANGDFAVAPTLTTRVLEELGETLSMSLKCRVWRTESDKYTLGDLLPGITERCAGYPGLTRILDRLDQTKFLRNLVGAHSTSWAEAYSDQDAQDFAAATLDLYDATVCGRCTTPLRLNKGRCACRCGNLQAA